MKQSIVLPSALKKRAKQIKNEQSLPLNKAYCEAAKEHGYSNYKNYKNAWEANQNHEKTNFDNLIKAISSEEDITKKMNLAITSIQQGHIPFDRQLKILILFKSSVESDIPYDATENAVRSKLKLDEDLRHKCYGVQPFLQYVCENVDLMKVETQAYLLKEFLDELSEDSIYGIDPDQFIKNDLLIRNCIYEIGEGFLQVDGDYSHTLKFNTEEVESNELPSHPYFADRLFSGSFGVEIDENKVFTLMHADG